MLQKCLTTTVLKLLVKVFTYVMCNDKLQHEMYWNVSERHFHANRAKINYNMRCIETQDKCNHAHIPVDKLQHEMYWNASEVRGWRPSGSDKLQHEMYWNSTSLSETISFPFDKLQHEMYWNTIIRLAKNPSETDKLQHEMYWNWWII